MPISLWNGWSQKGRLTASIYLGISVEGVIPTTNHLEAFNGILKRKHIHRWQHSGKRLRIDLLVYLLICQILPGIFEYRELQDEYKSWLQSRFLSAAGGVHLPTTRIQDISNSTKKEFTDNIAQPLAWWDSALLQHHQDEITHILTHKRLDLIRWSDPFTVSATCASRMADIRVGGYKRYPLWLTTYGMAFCTCPAFGQGTGA